MWRIVMGAGLGGAVGFPVGYAVGFGLEWLVAGPAIDGHWQGALLGSAWGLAGVISGARAGRNGSRLPLLAEPDPDGPAADYRDPHP